MQQIERLLHEKLLKKYNNDNNNDHMQYIHPQNST